MNPSPEVKAALRKTKSLPLSIKAIVYGGNLAGPPMVVQFNRDLKLYGLWEALLYVEGYEDEGKYRIGTARDALAAFTNEWQLIQQAAKAGREAGEQAKQEWERTGKSMLDQFRQQ